jgi:hypothetical protein
MTRAIVLILVSLVATSRADIAETAGKNVTKGAVKGAKEEVSNGDVKSGAKEVSAGVVEGISEHTKDIDRGLRDVTRSAAQGVFAELRGELGSDGHGPLSTAVGAAGAATGREIVRGVADEMSRWRIAACEGADPQRCADEIVQQFAYTVAKAAAKGFSAGAPSTIPFALAAGGGFAGGLLVAGMLVLLFNQRRMLAKLKLNEP